MPKHLFKMEIFQASRTRSSTVGLTSWRNIVTFVVSVTTLTHLPSPSHGYVTRIEQCEPIEIPRCQAMPYNMTQMPNLVHHNTQHNARLVFQRFEELLDSRCSDVLLFLLCAIYVPICPVSLLQREAIPPCRDVCERAKQGCEPVMNRYNVSWSDAFFDCSRLPWYERGVCVIPEAIVQKSDRGGQQRGLHQQQQHHHQHQQQQQQHHQRQHPRKSGTDGVVVAPAQRKGRFPVCRCKRKRPSWKWFRKYDYDYAVRATMKKRKRNKRGELLYRVKVTQVLFPGKVKVETNKMSSLLVITSQCSCLKMRKGREYLILGHENRDTNRLMVSQLSITARWRDVFTRRIAKWHKRLEKRKRQNRRNRTDVPSLNSRNRQTGGTLGDTGSSVRPGNDLGSPFAAPGDSSTKDSKGESSSAEPSSPNSDSARGTGRRRGGGGRGKGGGSQGYGSFNLDDLQNGYRHGGRYYSKELAQLHRYKLAALRELLE